jgi:hypothetical protein
VEADERRSLRALAIVKEQERRRVMGIRGSSPALAQLRANRRSPLAGAANPVIRRESAMSAFSLGTGDTESASTPRDAPVSNRGRGRGRGGVSRPSPLGRGAGGGRPPRPSSLNPSRTAGGDVRIDMPPLARRETRPRAGVEDIEEEEAEEEGGDGEEGAGEEATGSAEEGSGSRD